MSSQQGWCTVNLAPLYSSVNGNKLLDIPKGAVVEKTGETAFLSMRGADHTQHEVKWMEVIFRTGTGTYKGWVRENLFDDYLDKFPAEVVEIPKPPEESTGAFPHSTRNPSDAPQYLVLGKDDRGRELVKTNLCGEFCVAFVAGIGIKEQLQLWKNQTGSLYQWVLGGDSDKSTNTAVIKDMLNSAGFTEENGQIIEFTTALNGAVFKDHHTSPGKFERMLESQHLIANVVIDKFTGKLIPDDALKQNWTNHWVVLEKVIPNGAGGGRSEIYNPFINRRQEYSYEYFIRSFGGGTYSGVWVRRNRPESMPARGATVSKKWLVASENLLDSPAGSRLISIDEGAVVTATKVSREVNGVQWRQIEFRGRTGWAREDYLEDYTDRFPDNEVLIPHQTPDEEDAAQYMNLPGESGVKHNMCGQLCAAFIMEVDIESFIAEWKVAANNYYKKALAGGRDAPTGIDSVRSMFRPSPYDAKEGEVLDFETALRDPITNRPVISPGSLKRLLETHYLVAGVRIKPGDKYAGRLSGQGIGHWVVLDKITPNGALSGAGGWVEIYNPFPNKRQEYTYDEFMRSFSGYNGIWVKRK